MQSKIQLNSGIEAKVCFTCFIILTNIVLWKHMHMIMCIFATFCVSYKYTKIRSLINYTVNVFNFGKTDLKS